MIQMRYLRKKKKNEETFRTNLNTFRAYENISLTNEKLSHTNEETFRNIILVTKNKILFQNVDQKYSKGTPYLKLLELKSINYVME